MYDRELLLENITSDVWKRCDIDASIAYADIQDLDFSNTNLIVLLFALSDMIARNRAGNDDIVWAMFKTDLEDMIIWLHEQDTDY